MRPSQCQRLLEIEEQRTGWRRGSKARVQQLKWATGVTLLLYLLSRYHSWRYPRPRSHVWIDNVPVEVLEDSWAENAGVALLSGVWFFASLLVAHLLCMRSDHREHKPARRCDGSAYAGTHEERGADASTIRPLRREGARRAVDLGSDGRGGGGGGGGGRGAGAGTDKPPPTTQPRLDPTKPMRTPADLESFLQRVSLEQRRQRTGARSLDRSDGADFFAVPPAADPPFLGPTGGGLTADGSLHVRYHQHGGSSGGARGQGLDGAVTERDWEGLGIHNLDHALVRTREWVSDLCRRLITEVEESDRWFNANGVEAYSCGHSLREALQVSVPPPAQTRTTAGWGTGSSFLNMQPVQPQQPSVQTITKQQALVEHRALIQRGDSRSFDTILRLDQRIALEAKLDVTGTFPESARLSNAELCARQQYVLQRLRTFAKQRTLAAYRHNGGDTDTWREGFPLDAHLLLHVVRTSVEGMGSYVRFGYQGSSDKTQDLAIYIGDTGEPYFYVRYRGPAQDRLYATRTGVFSLFEAVLAFAAIIHVYHNDTYGGIRGTMDLKRASLMKVLREPKFAAAWAATY